jgi:hypothetical protein
VSGQNRLSDGTAVINSRRNHQNPRSPRSRQPIRQRAAMKSAILIVKSGLAVQSNSEIRMRRNRSGSPKPASIGWHVS